VALLAAPVAACKAAAQPVVLEQTPVACKVAVQPVVPA
jgi:hypothetical protein